MANGSGSRDKKLYFVNLDPPDPRILLVLAERASQNLCISGEEAAFENLMEQLQCWHCSRLADIAGICLTSPERYPIHCAAFLHDLGYFSAYGGGHSVTGLNLSGWQSFL